MKKLLILLGVIGITLCVFIYLGFNPDEKFGKSSVEAPKTSLTAKEMNRLQKDYPFHNAVHEEYQFDCVTCHGDFEDPREIKPVTNEVCASCHGDYERVAERTSFLDEKEVNPHDGYHHEDTLDCITCHKEHQEPTNYCSNCHNSELWMNETP